MLRTASGLGTIECVPCQALHPQYAQRMNVFDFITEAEMEDLPEDPRAAFVEFVRISQRRLTDIHRSYSDEESSWRIMQDEKYDLMNVIIAAAKRYAISPFSEMPVPPIDRYKSEYFEQFAADLNHYITQIVIDRNITGRRDSARLPDGARDRIRSHIHHLRESVQTSKLDDVKKGALLEKLLEFERALDKNRMSFLTVARVALEIMAVPGAMWGSYEATTKLVSNIMQSVAEAKAVEDEQRRLPPDPKPFALLPPRAQETVTPPLGRFGGGDLEDDIPF